MKLNKEKIRAEFVYLPDIGKLFRKSTGKIVNGSSNGRYLQIVIDGKKVYYHRAIWTFLKDEEITEIDHINGDKFDNKIENLRNVSHYENVQNFQETRYKNKQGKIGIGFYNGKWRAKIKVKNKSIHLGYFDTPELAGIAYLKAKKQHHKFSSF